MGVIAQSLGVRIAGRFWLFRELDLTVRAGQCAVVVGPNGSGKTTLLRCLYGVREPTAGTIEVAGRTPDESSVEFRRRVSVLFDDTDIFPELTPVQHLDLLAGSFGVELPDVDGMLVEAGLHDRTDVAAGSFSSGQRRRLMLLGATARPHDVLLLDEPERALDAAGKEWLTDLIHRATEAGAAAVLATHHPPLLELADVVVDMT
ncbi:MAG: ATP-binding cassette domain-containing protein [Labedaea sp.]